MASWSEMSGGAKGTAVAVVVALVGGGYGVWRANAPVAVEEPAVAAVAPAADAVAPAEPVAEAPAAVAAPAPEPVAAPVAPSFDVARIEPDGSALVAGQAAAGSVISIMAGGVEVATATADNAGKFVAMFTLPQTGAGQLLSMVAKLPDGSEVAGTGQVAVAALQAPAEAAPAEAVAEAAPAEAAPAEPAPADVVAEVAPAEPAADAAPTALAITEEGVKVLQSGADAVANVSLDVISYPSATEVQFGGRGGANSFVRLYMDNVARGDEIKVGADGAWTSTLTGIEPGIYTLRVDQVDAAGKVTARFETPFKRETPEALATALGTAAPEASPAEVAEAAPVVADAAPAGTVVATTEAAPAETVAATTEAAPAETVAAPTETAPAEAVVATTEAAPAETVVATTEAAPAETVATTEAAPAETVAATEAAPAEPVPAPAEPAVADVAAVPAEAAPAEPVVAEPVVAEPLAAEPAVVAAPAPVTITVQPGFTLWAIAQQNFGNGVLYVQVFEANRDKIRDPDLIYPGQVFTIPAN